MSDNYNSEIKRLQDQRKSASSGSSFADDASDSNASNYGISLSGRGHFDSDIYGNGELDKSLYSNSIIVDDFEDSQGDQSSLSHPSSASRRQINGSRALIDSSLSLDQAEDSMDAMKYREQFGSGLVDTRISSRESEVMND